jgi:N-acetylglucosaminyl-diphospho-decaprenol L-rhamnosyltransferase
VTGVRVGIVSWNTAALLDQCLAALPAALDGLDAEVVVVDNHSADGSAAVAAQHDGVTVVANPANRGYAAAMNQALAGSDAPALLALNPDTAPPPGSLRRLVDELGRHPEAGLVAPRLLNPDGTVQHSVYRFPSVAVAAAVGLLPAPLHRGPVGRRFWLEGHAPHDTSGPVDWAIGAVHCIRAAALAGKPPYRERWFMYVEDLDLCWRLGRAGWQVRLVADVAVPHVGNAAGAQAWGESRTLRWMDATYDWYGLERGRTAARAWAAVNLVGVTGKLAAARVGLALGRPGADRRRWWAGQLRSWLPVHFRKLLRGP